MSGSRQLQHGRCRYPYERLRSHHQQPLDVFHFRPACVNMGLFDHI